LVGEKKEEKALVLNPPTRIVVPIKTPILVKYESTRRKRIRLVAPMGDSSPIAYNAAGAGHGIVLRFDK
jgi:hypothetical protein